MTWKNLKEIIQNRWALSKDIYIIKEKNNMICFTTRLVKRCTLLVYKHPILAFEKQLFCLLWGRNYKKTITPLTPASTTETGEVKHSISWTPLRGEIAMWLRSSQWDVSFSDLALPLIFFFLPGAAIVRSWGNGEEESAKKTAEMLILTLLSHWTTSKLLLFRWDK